MSNYESYAEYYHELTKYSPEGLASSKHIIEFDKQPDPFKQYPNKKTIDLSYLLPLDRNPFSDAGIKNPKDFSKSEESLSALSKLLYFSNGVTAVIPADKPLYLRSSPSAGGLYPTEIYVIASNHTGLEDGIYNYQVNNQSLVQIKKGNFRKDLANITFNHPAFTEEDSASELQIVLTGVFYRSSWRYQDRAYRRICLDTGHIIGNIDLVSSQCGLKPVLIGGFNDEKLNQLLELDGLEEFEEEQSLAIISLINEEKNYNYNFPTALPSKLDNTKIKTPEGIRLLQLHDRSKIDKYINVPNLKSKNVEEKFKLSPPISLINKKNDLNWSETLLPTIVKRRSTRAYTGEAITKEELSTMLDFTYHPDLFSDDRLNPNPDYFDLSLIKTFIAVNNIQGLEEGCYFYSKDTRNLRQVRFKNFKDDLCYLCLGQELGLKASAVIFHTCDLQETVFKYGERAYRYLHLDAGHLGQKLNLAAINMNLGASGIGGFFDNQVNELLGIPEDEAVIYITTIGIPKREIT